MQGPRQQERQIAFNDKTANERARLVISCDKFR